MGWAITPTILRLPLMKRSERDVALWGISLVVLVRLKALLDHMDRRFELTSSLQRAPKSRVDWTEYSTRRMAIGDFLARRTCTPADCTG